MPARALAGRCVGLDCVRLPALTWMRRIVACGILLGSLISSSGYLETKEEDVDREASELREGIGWVPPERSFITALR